MIGNYKITFNLRKNGCSNISLQSNQGKKTVRPSNTALRRLEVTHWESQQLHMESSPVRAVHLLGHKIISVETGEKALHSPGTEINSVLRLTCSLCKCMTCVQDPDPLL